MGSRKTSVLIDETLLDEARQALGTETIRETIERALREVLRAQARAAEVESLADMKELELDDPEIMPRAWRR